MKKIIISSFILFICKISLGQNAKKTIGIALPDESADYSYYSGIEESIVGTRKFIVAERGQMQKIKQERKLQKSEDYIERSKQKDGSFQGIDYLVVFFRGELLQVKIVDINTTEILDIKSFNYQEYKEQIPIWLNTIIPSLYTVVELKDNTIVFAGGTFDLINVGDVLLIVEEKKYDSSKIRYKKVGEIRVSTVDGPNFSTGKIKSAKKAVKSIPIKNLKIQKKLISSVESHPVLEAKKQSYEAEEQKPKKKREWGLGEWLLTGCVSPLLITLLILKI